jgi:hypothetical protein
LELKDNKLAIELNYFPSHEAVRTDHLPLGELVMMEVDPSSPLFKFPGTLTFETVSNIKIVKELAVCLDNSKNLEFQVLKSVYEFFMAKLCEEPTDCTTKDDLNEFKDEDQVLELHMIGKVIRNASLKDGKSIFI